MNTELTPFPSNVPAKQENALVEIESARAVQEVQAAMVVAKKFPRDQMEAYTRIMKACERPSLAESATYVYPRGGQKISGPSIRLAETVAQNWGNLQYGVRELTQKDGESEVEAFAWDVETNTRQVKVFKVPHIRQTKSGKKKLTDPRDIYEMVANQGARRLRACVLGVIPGDIIEAAVNQCDNTLKKGGDGPIEDRVRGMLTAFEKIGVTKEMIEARLQHNTTAIVETQLVDLRKIYNSIKDGMSKREDWFTVSSANTSQASEDLTEKIKAAKPPEEPKPEPAYPEDLENVLRDLFINGDAAIKQAAKGLRYNEEEIPKTPPAQKKLWDRYQEIVGKA